VSDTYTHIPVLAQEVIEGLQIQPGYTYIDATFGRGGHTRMMLEAGASVLAFDCDQEAIEYGKEMFADEITNGSLTLIHENFDQLEAVIKTLDGGRKQIDGILADFGVSSPQLEEQERGFSFLHDAPLDMRLDQRLGVTAKDLVNGLGKHELFDLLTTYAQEQFARSIVEAILRERKRKPIETTKELADAIEKAVGRRGKLHPATKTFMALRMVVNDELGVIKRFLPQAYNVIQNGGRIATISFQESEDRIVKLWMKQMQEAGKGEMTTKKPIEATGDEIERNNRSRSAKLRIFMKKEV